MLALWFGLGGGLVQGALFAVQRWVLHHYTRTSFQMVWTAPVALACALLVPATAVWAMARLRPGLRWWQPTVTVFGFLTAFGVLLSSHKLHVVAMYVLAAGVGVQAGRIAAARRDLATRVVRLTVPALVVLVAGLAGAINGTLWLRERRALAALPAAPAGTPSVLLLILDTVRALNLSVHGYARGTAPTLERLAARGVTFDRAYAPAPWTLASHATIFTGVMPRELGVGWEVPLDGRHPTLAEQLAAGGYVTAGFVGNQVFASDESGLGRGFIHYDAVGLTLAEIAFSERFLHYLMDREWFKELTGMRDLAWRRSAGEIRASATAWLDRHRGRPYFAFVNFYDAHNPYLPPAPWDTLFSARVPWSARNLWVDQTDPVSTADAAIERDAYDNAIAYLDHEIGAMLEDLERRGLLENTVVVVTSDHGEEFGEHGLLGHGNSLYLPSLHVPLIVAWPGRVPAGTRVAAPVALRDLPATLLDLAGREGTLPGRSLRRLWSGDTASADSVVLAEVPYSPRNPAWFPASGGDMAAAMTAARQIVVGGTRREEVFDLQLDPTGGRPAGDGPDAIARLRALVPDPGPQR